MSIVGVFTKAQPSIGGLFFDAMLEEATEMVSEVTEYPLESGAVGADHVAQKPLIITMTVGVSNNPFRALAASSSIPLTGNLVGAAAGAAVGQLGGEAAAAVGVGISAVSAAFSAGQEATRSQSVLAEIRALQRAGAFVDVVSSTGATYTNCLIRNTRQQVNKANEQGMELVVELIKPLILNTDPDSLDTILGNLPANDTANTQAQPLFDLGEVSAIA